MAALVEPFSFQILRHIGAALGWWTFLSRDGAWGRQKRVAAMDTNPLRPRARRED